VEKVPLSIKGYDPVAYFTIGKPVPGLPEFEYEWDEHRYRFSRPEHRELFKANPVLYAPQFANFCAMALTRGEFHDANPEYWLISDGKLYIFGLATDRAVPEGPDGQRCQGKSEQAVHPPLAVNLRFRSDSGRRASSLR
jgi:hypothetical protein